MTPKEIATEFFRARYTELLQRFAEETDLGLCDMANVSLLELAKHYVAVHEDVDEGLAHLSEHLDQVGELLEPDTLH